MSFHMQLLSEILCDCIMVVARLAHSSVPRNLLLDVGTQVPDPVTKLAQSFPVLGIVSSQQLHHYRLEARTAMIYTASFAAVIGSL